MTTSVPHEWNSALLHTLGVHAQAAGTMVGCQRRAGVRGGLRLRPDIATAWPHQPTAPNQPLAKPGADAVINPTTEECRKGWDPGLRWTKEQFEEFCARMKAAK